VSPVRTLIVDDSPTVRAVIRRMIEVDPGIEVVGESGDGKDALQRCAALEPDVVLLDLDLPILGGIDVARSVTRKRKVSFVVVSAKLRGHRIVEAFRSTDCGVVAVFEKPETPDAWKGLGDHLRTTIRQLGKRYARASSARSARQTRPAGLRWVAIGGSTGGPAALRQLLGGLDETTPLGIAVVQHISPGFEAGMAEWLSSELDRDIRVAVDGEPLEPGIVRVAPHGSHLRLSSDGRLCLDQSMGPLNGHRPSVDCLFLSLADHPAPSTAAVLLSGMGSDGAEGMRVLAEAGVLTIVQDQSSCPVFGMPAAALERGGGDLILPPQEIARALMDAVGDGNST
jgi:two-component system chemotaxis response regulator CheB